MRDQRYLDIAVTRVFMKIFRTGSSLVITECQRNFHFLSIQRQLTIRTAKFLQAFAASANYICQLFNSTAANQLNIISSSFSVTSTMQLYTCILWSAILRAVIAIHINVVLFIMLSVWRIKYEYKAQVGWDVQLASTIYVLIQFKFYHRPWLMCHRHFVHLWVHFWWWRR